MNGRTSKAIAYLLLVALLILPSEARASDTTGAFIMVLGLGLIGCFIFGLVLALVLKFVFKRGHWVWALIPAIPIGAIMLFLLAQFFDGNYDRNYHSGPDLDYNGSTSVTVSPDYNQKNLDQALILINAPSFKSELAKYTDEQLTNYVFAIDLTAPGKREARHYVTICISPKVEVNTPVYEGIMYLFTKAVIASDPNPHMSDNGYSEPPKTK